MVKIRLTRIGAKKHPHYRVVAIDERKQRDGRPLEYLGTYDPGPSTPVIHLRQDAIDAWIAKGAQLSDTVRSLVKQNARAAAAAPAGEA